MGRIQGMGSSEGVQLMDVDLAKLARAHEARRSAVYAAAPLAATVSGPLVIDIAWARPTVSQIRATGAVGVVRYFSPDATKNLHPSEVADYLAAGWGTATVFESTAGRATAGRAAGYADARLAEQQRAACGLPADHVHHFAVDSDVSWPSVQAYFTGAADAIGLDRVGTYGGYSVVEGAHGYGVRHLWQTVAWSAGRISSHAALYQSGGTVLGGDADINHVLLPDWGQYPRPGSDMALTTTDADVIIDRLIARRDETTFATAYWLRRAFDPSIPLPTGPGLPQVVAEVAAFRAALVAQRGRDAATIQSVINGLTAVQNALAGMDSPTAAQVQAGVDEALRGLGTYLSALPAA